MLNILFKFLTNIASRYSDYENFLLVPKLDDPGLDGETLKTSMTLAVVFSFLWML